MVIAEGSAPAFGLGLGPSFPEKVGVVEHHFAQALDIFLSEFHPAPPGPNADARLVSNSDGPTRVSFPLQVFPRVLLDHTWEKLIHARKELVLEDLLRLNSALWVQLQHLFYQPAELLRRLRKEIR